MNGYCTHEDFDINTYEYIKEKRDIFKCPKHKDGADYSDYLVKDRPTKQEKLAPVNALPKHSKGDNPKYRFKLETARGKVSPIKTVDAKGNKHIYKITKNGIKEIKWQK